MALRRGVTVAELLEFLITIAQSEERQYVNDQLAVIVQRLDALERRREPTVQKSAPAPAPSVPPTMGDVRQSGIGGPRVPMSQAVIDRITELAHQGLGRRQIARALAAEQIFVSESTAEKYRHAAVAKR
uniref:hypothetical protein n=1 Tax=Paramagnetospirillum magneticum TaxID=84159 RepID=UPI001595586D|nr:hypothetical protein [Paramagnetospirillum magneticum]